MISDSVFARYRSKGVLIDTNLLLLYIIGAFDRKEIGRFKRTIKFLPEDFDLLVRFMGFFQSVVTTPHILTEVSNLASQIGDHAKGGVFAKIAQGVVVFRAGCRRVQRGARFHFGTDNAALIHPIRVNRYRRASSCTRSVPGAHRRLSALSISSASRCRCGQLQSSEDVHAFHLTLARGWQHRDERFPAGAGERRD